MKHLGIDIIWSPASEIYFADIGKDKYIHENYDNLKRDVIRLVLPTYKPTKTLEWLEEKTGVELEFSNSTRVLFTKDKHPCYDFDVNVATVSGEKINITGTVPCKLVYMSPREFIDKIAKGEWI